MCNGRMLNGRMRTTITLLTVLLLMSVGCSENTKARVRATMAVSSMAETREEIVKGQTQAYDMITTLRNLQKPDSDIKATFSSMKGQIADIKVQRERIRNRAVDMRARSSAYQNKWREEIMKISDPTLADAAKARADQVAARYDHIIDLSNEAAAEYEPFIRLLTEQETYFSNDLTRAGVTAAKPAMDKTIAQGELLNTKLNELVEQMNIMTATMTPTGRVPQ